MRNRLGIGLIALMLLTAMNGVRAKQHRYHFRQGHGSKRRGSCGRSHHDHPNRDQRRLRQRNQPRRSVPRAGLPPGTYRVTVNAPGFKKAVRDGLLLRIGENQDLEVKLEAGAVAETVEVTGALPLIDTQTSSAGQVMEGEYFYQLPNYQHWKRACCITLPRLR